MNETDQSIQWFEFEDVEESDLWWHELTKAKCLKFRADFRKQIAFLCKMTANIRTYIDGEKTDQIGCIDFNPRTYSDTVLLFLPRLEKPTPGSLAPQRFLWCSGHAESWFG